MKRIYFVRHGESEANVARINGGEHHPLTERGRKQAEFIAARCAKLPIQAVFSSTMLRAQQTGEVIAQTLSLPLKMSEYFVELRGPMEFMERPIDDPDVVAGFRMVHENLAPGYRYADEENFDDIVSRAGRGLDLLTEQPEEHIAVVSHGLFLRALIARALYGSEITPREYIRLAHGFKSENTGLTILEYRSSTPQTPWRLWVWNDHAHLG